MRTIKPFELNQRLKAGQPGHLLDVRTPVEFAALRAPDVILEPLESLDATRVAARYAGGKAPVYVFCRTGTRAKEAIARLEKAGLSECVLVEGGIAAWQEAGLPTEGTPSKTISLERQVRIAAGAFVFAGTLLGAFWNLAFLVVPAFVGAGLIFAGVTDRCGLALVLARMPWNQSDAAHRGGRCAAQTT